MKNFRNNLHSVFFFPGSNGNGYSETPENNEELPEEELVEQQTRKKLDEHREEVQEQEFPNVAWEVAAKVSSKYTDMELLKRDRARFQERVTSPYSEKKAYWDVWAKKITEGFGVLKTALIESKYFEGKTEQEIQDELSKIKEKYQQEVYSQYEEIIRSAGNKTFNSVKDSIFWPDSREYPANKIYCKLTWAVTIFKRERTKTRTYDVDPVNKKEDWQDSNNENDEVSVSTKKKMRFIAHDLPNYLRQVKDKTTLQKIWGFIPFIRLKVDKPSLEDKKQLEIFIKATDKLGGDKPELKLMEVFDNLPDNATEKQIREALGLDEKISVKTIKKAFKFYKSTYHENLNPKNQHALYLSILEIVKKQWWFSNTISAFEKDVEEYKNRENSEWKEYKKWDKLDKDLKDFADILWIRDYASATRLSEKSDKYFEETDVVDILADLNNDGILTFADKWLTKTWLQFKEIFNSVWEDAALKNLLDVAKLDNKRLNSPLKDEEFTKEEIKKWNKKLILLLQNIISNPKADLSILMTYGADASEKLSESKKLLEEAESKKDKAATELLKNVDLSNLKIDGGEVASAEWLHQAVAWALYGEYARWVGLWWKITFDEWVKWISLNGWIQAGDKWVGVWLTLAYNREISLWKWWSVTPGASIGFVPMFKFAQSAWVEIAKKWINDNNVQEKLWLRASFTNIAWGIRVYSALLWYERDHLAWIEWNRREIESLFKSKIVSPLLENIANEFKDKEFDLSIDDNLKKVKELIWAQVSKLDEWGEDALLNSNKKVDDIRAMVDNTARYILQNCNKTQIQDKTVRDIIASDMSYDYSYTRAELNKEKLDWKTKFSDARIGASWVQAWSVWALVVHAWIWSTEYSKDIYWDGAIRSHTIKMDEKFKDSQKWDGEMIKKFNQYMPEGSKFELVELWEGEEKKEYIKVPAQAIRDCDILINSGMRWLIKKDESGNILLSTETVIDMPTRLMWAARTSTEVLIWWWDKTKSVHLDSVINDDGWFAQWDIDTSKLTGKESISFDLDSLNSALTSLKKQLPDEKDLQEFNFDESILDQLERGKKYIIVLEKTSEWIKPKVQEVQEWSNLRIEYDWHESLDLMSENAQNIANKVYAEALKVTTNRLYSISHDIRNNQGVITHKKWKEYTNFANAVKDQNYSNARDVLLGMLPKMDKYIGEGVKFSSIIEDLNKITDESELWQAMLSVNNIFARVASVHWGKDWEYHFKKYKNWELVDRSMWDVISWRAKEINRKISNSWLDDNTKQAYQNLVNFAEKHRENNVDKYSDISKKGKIYEWAIWINLWNSISLENPLFNPEVYESPVIDSSELNFEWKDKLQEHIMKDVIANNKSLLQPILSALWLEWNSISVVEWSYDKENWKITLDIDWKNVILGADMKFGYFAQCVNHMLLIDNISAEIPWEWAYVDFKSSVVRDGRLDEAKLNQLYWKKRKWIDVAFTVHREEEIPEKEKKPEYQDWSDPSDWKDKTTPEQEGHPIGEWETDTWDDEQKDNIWTDWEKDWGDNPDVDDENQGDL